MMRASKFTVMGASFALSFLPGVALAETNAPADAAQEEAFLDVLPKIEIPDDVQPIPDAVNEEFRSCRSAWPEGYKLAQSGQEARALRDIYGLVQAQNVIKYQDCTCAGKVADWQTVETIADSLRMELGVKVLSWQQTKEVAVEADRLTVIAETMCGGSF